MPNGPDLITETEGIFTLPSAAWHRSFAVTSSGPEPRSSSCIASGPGARLTTARSMRCCGMEELPGKPGLQNKQQPAEQSLFSWDVTLLEPNLPPAPFANQMLEGISKKAYDISKITTLAIHAVIAFSKCPTLRIWKWWKDRFWHWCAPAGLVSSSQCQYKEQDLLYPMCLYTFFPNS